MSKSYEDGVRFGKQFSPVRLTLQLVDMERQRDEARRLAEEMYDELTRVRGLADWIDDKLRTPPEERFRLPWKKEGGEG